MSTAQDNESKILSVHEKVIGGGGRAPGVIGELSCGKKCGEFRSKADADGPSWGVSGQRPRRLGIFAVAAASWTVNRRRHLLRVISRAGSCHVGQRFSKQSSRAALQISDEVRVSGSVEVMGRLSQLMSRGQWNSDRKTDGLLVYLEASIERKENP